MTGIEAAKAPCPYRIKHTIRELILGGCVKTTYVYAPCLGHNCLLWRMARPGDVPRLCAGTGRSLDKCIAAHNVAGCETCPDREGYCGR